MRYTSFAVVGLIVMGFALVEGCDSDADRRSTASGTGSGASSGSGVVCETAADCYPQLDVDGLDVA
jgi:hypothetical protein